VRFTLISVYLLILVGGIVRATGSGMGCPDWPRCFGLWIPPTQESQIRFQSSAQYEKGMMVIENDTLWVSRVKQLAAGGFIRENWYKYPKHDYAVYNVFQTWTEYLNRLLGALVGLFVFIGVLIGIPILKHNTKYFLLALFLLILTGFQGWLGALVVDYHLAPLRITVHMLVALAMVAVLIFMQHSLSVFTKYSVGSITSVVYAFLILLLIQVVMGTQVRQEVDIWMKGFKNIPDEWSTLLSVVFDFHRVMAIALFFMALFLFNKMAQNGGNPHSRNLILLVVFEGLVGMFLSGLSLPNFIQPVHLVLSALLFGTSMRLLVSVKK